VRFLGFDVASPEVLSLERFCSDIDRGFTHFFPFLNIKKIMHATLIIRRKNVNLQCNSNLMYRNRNLDQEKLNRDYRSTRPSCTKLDDQATIGLDLPM
jgi:hypothetical protein